jgi:hypothetical protein
VTPKCTSTAGGVLRLPLWPTLGKVAAVALTGRCNGRRPHVHARWIQQTGGKGAQMSIGAKFIKQTVIGGVLFLVPIVLVVLLLKRTFKMVQPPVDAIAQQIHGWHVFGLAVAEILTAILLVAFCFVAGLLATTRLARRSVRVLESAVLAKVPGYELIKAAGENMGLLDVVSGKTGLLKAEEEACKVVLVIESEAADGCDGTVQCGFGTAGALAAFWAPVGPGQAPA